jgi:hypothetical protein
VTRSADIAVAAGFTLAGAIVIVAPAVAMRWGVLHDGVGSLDADILVASLAVAAFNAAVSWERLLYEERAARERLHVWIASLNALVALALGATVLVVFVLLFFPDEHASLADRGFPVIILWAGTQLVAVLLAEATARLCFGYLEPGAPRPP